MQRLPRQHPRARSIGLAGPGAQVAKGRRGLFQPARQAPDLGRRAAPRERTRVERDERHAGPLAAYGRSAQLEAGDPLGGLRGRLHRLDGGTRRALVAPPDHRFNQAFRAF